MTAETSKKKDRPSFRLRFSLRALLATMLLACCVVSWTVSKTRLAMRQHEAVLQIRDGGGHATYEYQLKPNGRDRTPPLPIRGIRWYTGDVVVSDVVKVSWHLTQGGDADTQALSDLPHLRDLRINSRRLSDDAIAHLSGLQRLQRLDLWCSQITDQALVHVRGLRDLRQLDLYSTQVTDAGLKHLHQLQKLEELKLRGTKVTREGVEQLQQVLPNCKIMGVD